MKQSLGLIIINFNAIDDTLECLDSLLQSSSKTPFEVYVVNFQHPEQAEKIKSHALKPTVIQSENNLGFAGHNNLAINKALDDGHEYIMLLNNDTTVAADCIDPLVASLQSEPGMVSPKIYFYKGQEFHKDYAKKHLGKVIWYAGGVIDWLNMITLHRGVDEVDRGQFEKEMETDFATGCCLVTSRQVIDTVGLMNEAYFMYYEDVEWGLRAKQTGYSVRYSPSSHIWHKNAQSSGGSGSDFQNYYQTRNRIKLGLKYAPLKTKLALIKEAVKQIKSSSKVKSKAAMDGLLGKMGKQK